MTPDASTIALREVGMATASLPGGPLHVVWPFEGQLEVRFDDGSACVAPGHSMVIAPGRSPSWRAPRGARCFVVTSHDARHVERLPPLAGQVRANDPAVAYLLRYLAAQPALSPSAADLLLDSMAVSSGLVPRSTQRAIDWPRLLGWVDLHLEQPLCVAVLAAQVHLSPTQFTARCTAEFGIAPMALVRRQRMAAALRLRAIGVPVASVAARCGYRSPSALTAALRRDALLS